MNNILISNAIELLSKRCLSISEAATYLCVKSIHTKNGFLVEPVEINGKKVWDKKALDRFVDGLGSEGGAQ